MTSLNTKNIAPPANIAINFSIDWSRNNKLSRFAGTNNNIIQACTQNGIEENEVQISTKIFLPVFDVTVINCLWTIKLGEDMLTKRYRT